jgi:hypothetical protein
MPVTPQPGLSLALDPEALRPLVQLVLDQALARLDAARATLPEGKLCYSEEEAARLLGLEPHVLRDERRRGRIGASSIVGRRIRYLHQDLLDYLLGRRVPAGNAH